MRGFHELLFNAFTVTPHRPTSKTQLMNNVTRVRQLIRFYLLNMYYIVKLLLVFIFNKEINYLIGNKILHKFKILFALFV